MSLTARAFLAAMLSLDLSASALADDPVRLSRLAAASGYTYQWLASESGVTLQRPGVTIVLHAGYPLYEVNSAPAQADSAPRFDHGDLVVSPALAARLRRIAAAYPQAYSPVMPPPQSSADSGVSSAASGVLTITARQIPGREALVLSGTGPANVPVTITVTGELSVDLPTVILSRFTVMSASDGKFSAVASIGQDTHRGTKIAAIATSIPDVVSATARFVLGAPSPDVVHSNLDEFPPK